MDRRAWVLISYPAAQEIYVFRMRLQLLKVVHISVSFEALVVERGPNLCMHYYTFSAWQFQTQCG
jgi:hypothetical protein